MTQEETVMEQLFKTLDEKVKDLNDGNGQSFIENLGLAMEHIYTNKRELLEQATLQDRRKAFQFAYLSLMQKRRYTSKSSNYTRFYWPNFRLFS